VREGVEGGKRRQTERERERERKREINPSMTKEKKELSCII
jgi:hypothetical protein